MTYRSPKTELRPSPAHGTGLFCREPMAKGEIATAKGGHIYDEATHREVEARLGPVDVQIARNLFIGPLSEAEVAGSMMFLNHSCTPNLGLQGQIVFVTLREIAAGEELCFDYAMTDDEDYEMRCRCGSAQCRGVITGRDWRQPALQQRYQEWFFPYLQERIRSR